MENSKVWYLSKGIWGAVAVLLATGLQIAGYTINLAELNSFLDQILNLVTAVMTAVGAFVSLYGRVKATKRIE